MSRRPGRAVRFPDRAGLPEPPQAVPAIGPIVFSVIFDGRARVIDLSDLPCPRLVRSMAAQLATIGGQDGTVREWAGFNQMVGQLRSFVAFVAETEPTGAEQFDLGDLEPELLEAFETHLSGRYPPDSLEPHVCMRSVVRLLRMAGETSPGRLSLETFIAARRAAGRGLPALPVDKLHKCPGATISDGVVQAPGMKMIALLTGTGDLDHWRALFLRVGNELGYEQGGLDTVMSPWPDTGAAWRAGLGMTELREEIFYLRTACWIVIAYLSGMRDGEIRQLSRDCAFSEPGDDGPSANLAMTAAPATNSAAASTKTATCWARKPNGSSWRSCTKPSPPC